MSLTYPEPPVSNTAEAEYVPTYARKPVRRKKVRSWMILAPIGGVVLIGAAAAMLMNPSEPATPLAEPETAPAASPMAMAPTASADVVAMETAPTAAPAPIAPAPAASRAEPVRAEPIRRAATVQRPVQRQAAPAVEAAPTVEPTGPRPYTADPATSTSNRTPATPSTTTPAPTAPAPTPPAPAIATQPLN
ncbi:MAG: hypothetical protein ACT6RD_11440 [Brevundimonas sp.]|uniref:hypothetical protein n=1 Tax=Brevundimonas sp. TaxID=1871086 RepID=UPI004033DABB